MKKTRMPQRLLSLVLVLMMLISVLPVSAMAAELTPSDPETGLTATDVTNELTDSDRLAIFEENMDSGKVSRSEIPADDEMVKVIVQLDADSLLDVRNRTNASMSMLDFQQTDAAKAHLLVRQQLQHFQLVIEQGNVFFLGHNEPPPAFPRKNRRPLPVCGQPPMKKMPYYAPYPAASAGNHGAGECIG